MRYNHFDTYVMSSDRWQDFIWDAQTYCVIFFPVLNSFEMTNTSDVVVCVENEHCQLKCYGKPICEPHDACAVKWFQGSGTQNSVLQSENTTIDLEG